MSALALARAGFRISFLSTTKNIQHLPKLPQDLTSQITFVELPLPHEAVVIHGMLDPDASGISLTHRAISAVDGCEAIVLGSCAEYQGEYHDVPKKHPKPVIPIGLLPPEKREMTNAAGGGEWESIFRWLDCKAPRSAVFVELGSEGEWSRSEIYEIAHGLELSELDFL